MLDDDVNPCQKRSPHSNVTLMNCRVEVQLLVQYLVSCVAICTSIHQTRTEYAFISHSQEAQIKNTTAKSSYILDAPDLQSTAAQ